VAFLVIYIYIYIYIYQIAGTKFCSMTFLSNVCGFGYIYTSVLLLKITTFVYIYIYMDGYTVCGVEILRHRSLGCFVRLMTVVLYICTLQDKFSSI
jgi:hypothetical protein